MFVTSGYVHILCVLVKSVFFLHSFHDFSQKSVTFLSLGRHVLRDFRVDVLRRQRVLRNAILLYAGSLTPNKYMYRLPRPLYCRLHRTLNTDFPPPEKIACKSYHLHIHLDAVFLRRRKVRSKFDANHSSCGALRGAAD